MAEECVYSWGFNVLPGGNIRPLGWIANVALQLCRGIYHSLLCRRLLDAMDRVHVPHGPYVD